MECVDERLVEALDVVVVWRAKDRGEGRLGLHKEIICALGVSYGSDGKGDVPKARAMGRECSGERGDRAVVRAVEEVWRCLN